MNAIHRPAAVCALIAHFRVTMIPHQRPCLTIKKRVSKCKALYRIVISFLNYLHAIKAEKTDPREGQ